MLLENSFYTTPAELAALIADTSKVADLFYLNFIGFVGLLKVKDAPTLSTYIRSMGKLQLANMNDANKDWSLCVKLAHDAGAINTVAAAQLTKFLVRVKSGKITTTDINDDLLRDMLRQCRILSHKPSSKIYAVVADFISGKDKLETTTYRLWRLASKDENHSISTEFRDQVRLGGYAPLILKHMPLPADPVPAPAAAAPTVVHPTTALSPVALPPPKGQRGALPKEGAAKGTDAEYMSALLHVFKLKGGIHSYLERFGFKDHFDIERFKKAIASPEFQVAHGYHVPWKEHPFVQWIRKKDWAAAEQVVTLLNNKDRQAGNMAQAVQVANTVVPPPPAPPVVIHTIPDPIINDESVSALYHAKNDEEYQALLAKYHIPAATDVETFRSHERDLKLGLVRANANELMKPGADRFHLIHGSTFAKRTEYVIRHGTLLPVLNTLSKAGLALDGPALITILHDRDFAIELDNVGRRQLYKPALQDAIKDCAGSKPYEFMANNAKAIRDGSLGVLVFDTLSGKMPSMSTPFTRLEEMLAKVLLSNIGFQIDDLAEKFNLAGITAMKTGNASMILDKEAYDGIAGFDLKLLVDTMHKQGILNFKIERMDTDVARVTKFRDALSKSQSYAMAPEYISTIVSFINDSMDGKIDCPNQFSDETLRAQLSYVLLRSSNYQSVVSDMTVREKHKDWFYHQIIKLHPCDWTPAETYTTYGEPKFLLTSDFISWCQTHNHTQGIMDIAKYAMSFGQTSQDMMELAFKKYPALHDLCFTMLKNRGASYDAYGRVLDYTFVEKALDTLTESGLVSYASACSNRSKMTEAIKTITYAINKFKGTWQEPWNNSSSYARTILCTAWFVLPGDPHFDDAKKTISGVMHNAFDHGWSGMKPIVIAYNPEMYSFWMKHLEEAAGMDPTRLINLKNVIPPDQFGKKMAASMKDYSNDRIKADLKQYGSLSTNLLAMAAEDTFDKDAKKILLTKFAPAMEVANVHDIREKEQRDRINNAFTDLLLDVYESDSHLADKIFKDAPRTTRTIIVQKHGETAYIEAIKTDLYKHPIRPDFPLDHHRIRTILKYNRIPIKITSNRGIVQRIADIQTAVAASITKVGDLKVSDENHDEEGLDRATIRLNKFRNNNHGDVGIKILKSYNVDFPGNKARQEAFRAAYPRDGTLIPVFHGTGTVAAAMVLRNGFQILPSNDASNTGRMLGNGIYFSNIVSKASQYVGDRTSGITRRYGARGYIFEMEAELGQLGQHYRSAGTGGDKSTRSPEWAVFKPAEQLRIYKAYYVELVNITDITALATKYGMKLMENKSRSFSDFLFESGGADKDVSTFWFMGDTLPQTPTEIVEASAYKAKNNVYVEPFGDGGYMVSVAHSREIEAVSVTVPNTGEWLATSPNEVNLFFSLIGST